MNFDLSWSKHNSWGAKISASFHSNEIRNVSSPGFWMGFEAWEFFLEENNSTENDFQILVFTKSYCWYC